MNYIILICLDFGFAKREEVFHRWDSQVDGHASTAHPSAHAHAASAAAGGAAAGGAAGGGGKIYGRGFRTVCGTLSYLAPEVVKVVWSRLCWFILSHFLSFKLSLRLHLGVPLCTESRR